MWQQKLKDPRLVAAAIGASSFASGVAAGYVYATKKLDKIYAERAAKEIASAQTFYDMRVEVPDPEQLALNLGYEHAIVEDGRVLTEDEVEELAAERQGPEDEEPPKKVEYNNVFRDRHPGVVAIDPIMEDRGQKPIYVITLEEFNENADDHTQLELAYFEGDNVLTDGPAPIDNYEKYVGDALDRFGHGSKDPNVVYVRNHQMETDWCITRSDQKFQVAVLGMDDPDELRHDAFQRKSRKARARGDHE